MHNTKQCTLAQKSYLIIPNCSDLNRGDQALVWETRRLAQNAGCDGEFCFFAEPDEPTAQSEAQGLRRLVPVLGHPSRKFQNKNNIRYSASIKLRWGAVALGDLVVSSMLLNRVTRPLGKRFLNAEQRKSLTAFEGCDAVFMKGGGLLQTYGGLTASYSMYYFLYPIRLAEALGKPVYVLPNSYGPFEGPGVAAMTRRALSRCRLVTSRETLSQNMVRASLGLDIENYPDLAFCLPQRSTTKADVARKYGIDPRGTWVALTMRPYRFPHSSNPAKAYEDFKKAMADFITWLHAHGYTPVVIEHTRAVNAHENDGECIREVKAMMEPGTCSVISDDSLDCLSLKGIYGCCDYIVGTRFHSVIFSLSNGVPGLAISYVGNKTKGIMHDAGLDDYVLDISNVTADELERKFEHLVENEDDVKKKAGAYRKLSEEGFQSLTAKIHDLQAAATGKR